jgi:hypothetical protein
MLSINSNNINHLMFSKPHHTHKPKQGMNELGPRFEFQSKALTHR